MKTPQDHAQGLLIKANNDLIAAKAILATGKALDAVCFHTQQAAEKSLKALLALHDVTYPWRHDLTELIEIVAPLAPEIAPLAPRIIQLTPFAVEVRYDETFYPPYSEANDALKTATETYRLATQIVQNYHTDDAAL